MPRAAEEEQLIPHERPRASKRGFEIRGLCWRRGVGVIGISVTANSINKDKNCVSLRFTQNARYSTQEICKLKKITFSPIRWAKIPKCKNTRCWQGCGETDAPLHCWWEGQVVRLLGPQQSLKRTQGTATEWSEEQRGMKVKARLGLRVISTMVPW